MSFGLGLTIAIMVMIGFAFLVGRICHMGDLEKDPLDNSGVKPPSGAFLKMVEDSKIRRQ